MAERLTAAGASATSTLTAKIKGDAPSSMGIFPGRPAFLAGSQDSQLPRSLVPPSSWRQARSRRAASPTRGAPP